MEMVRENKRFGQLIKALESGWEIEEPVLLGALWRTTPESDGACHFVLKHKGGEKTTLLSLQPSPELLIFLAENQINVSTL